MTKKVANASAPVRVFFTTFVALALVIFGTLCVLVLGWFIYRTLRLRRNTQPQVNLPMIEMSTARRVVVQEKSKTISTTGTTTSTSGKAPSTVIVDEGMAGMLPIIEAMEPNEPNVDLHANPRVNVKEEEAKVMFTTEVNALISSPDGEAETQV